MAAGVRPPVGPPLGFPGCPMCQYLQGGSSWVCFSCARKAFEPIAPQSCDVCSQFLEADGTCPNWLCSDPARRIERIDAIAYLSGALRTAILAYKYDNKWGWAAIFGRVLVGWLDSNLQPWDVDLIIANPTWVEPGSMFAMGHTERVLEAAARDEVIGLWSFDLGVPRALVKTHVTAKSARNTASAKRTSARELRAALSIPDPSRIEGKRVLVYDDVCTTGSQLDAIAGYLLDEGGAAEVRAVVLARAPWRPRAPR